MTLQEVITSGKPFTRPGLGFSIEVFQNWFFIHERDTVTGTWTAYNVTMKDGKFEWTGDVPPTKSGAPEQVYMTPAGVLRTDWVLVERVTMKLTVASTLKRASKKVKRHANH